MSLNNKVIICGESNIKDMINIRGYCEHGFLNSRVRLFEESINIDTNNIGDPINKYIIKLLDCGDRCLGEDTRLKKTVYGLPDGLLYIYENKCGGRLTLHITTEDISIGNKLKSYGVSVGNISVNR